MAIPGRNNFDQHSIYIYIHIINQGVVVGKKMFGLIGWFYYSDGTSDWAFPPFLMEDFLDSFQHQPIINWNSRNKSI